MPRYNPFRPNSIVTEGMFCGRWEELKATEQALFQTKHGNPRHFLVCGERGIGKSSLFLCIDFVARGNFPTLDGTSLNFIVLTVELVGSTTYEDVVSYIAAEFKKKIAQRQKIKEFAKKGWEFITNWKVMGVEYKRSEDKVDDVTLIDSLCDGISQFLDAVGDEVDELLVLIDEADKPAEDARLGEFCKLFTENSRDCDAIVFV
jgi:Cdc6-like AAA superfamily ATPase